VIAEALRRSMLAGYAERFAALLAASHGGVSIRELPFFSQFDVRADPADSDVMQRLATALGFALPAAPNTVASIEDRRALWLGPDEWLVVGPEGHREALQQALRDGFSGAFGSIVDVSAHRTLLEIRGENAQDLLAHGIAIDLDPHPFPSSSCAQTLVAKAQVIIERHESSFLLYVRTSFVGHVAEWLLDAADLETTSGR
jgi:sarcosine oxidase, subunit gamma